MIDHVILVRWKAGLAQEDIDAVLAKSTMMEEIDGVESVTCRRTLGPTSGGRDKGFTHLMTLRLTDSAALAAFHDAPLHHAFGAIMISLVEDLVIVDVPI